MNRRFYIIFAFVLAFAGYKLYTKQTGTLNRKAASFAIPENTAITRVFIGNNSDSVWLQKEAKHWSLNGNYTARPKAIQILQKAVGDIEPKSSALAKEKALVLQNLNSEGIRVRLYKGEKLIKAYEFIDKGQSSLLRMKDSEDLFYAFIPGYKGKFKQIFNPDFYYWMNKSLVSLSPQHIDKVEFINFKRKSQNFSIQRNVNHFELYNSQNEHVNPIHKEKSSQYLQYFSNVEFTKLIGAEEELYDSLRQTEADFQLNVFRNSGNKIQLSFIPKFIQNNEKTELDLKQVYVLMNEEQLVLCNYVQVDPLLKRASYFK